MPGLQSTGRMRKAIMEQMSLIRTKKHGHWKLVPVPKHKNRSVLYTKKMLQWEDNLSNITVEAAALWEPAEEMFTFNAQEISTHWREVLQLEWTTTLLPSCVGCEYSNFKCTNRPPDFQCRILSMSKQTSLRPNVYWKRVIDLG